MRQGEPLVTVIIPSFKMGQFIGEALESVGAQTYPHWEVIVVDDAGPEDGTRATVEAFAAKHPDHRVEYIRHETNQGVSVARRMAFEASRGEYIAFLDADDAFLPEKLAKHLAVLGKNPDVVLVHGPVVEVGDWPRGEQGPATWFRPSSQSMRYDARRYDLASRNHICNSTVVVRRAAIRAEDFAHRMYFQFEDAFLWLGLADRGDFCYEDEALTAYRYHAGSFTASVMAGRGLVEFGRLELILARFPYVENWSQRVAAGVAILENLEVLMASRSVRGADCRGRYGIKFQLALLCAGSWRGLQKVLRFGARAIKVMPAAGRK